MEDTDERIVGELPETVKYEQEGTLAIIDRLNRDRLLYSDNHDTYDGEYIVRRGINAPGRDLELLEMVEVTNRKYYNILQDVVDEYISRVDVDTNMVHDLVYPERIPNEHNARSRSRVRDILSIMYKRNRDDRGDPDMISPYEVLMQLTNIVGGVGATGVVSVARYMNVYPMIVKSIFDNKNHDSDVFLSEYLVGIVMNRIRDTIPNFVYTYGITKGFRTNSVETSMYYLPGSANDYTLCIEYISNAINVSHMGENMIATVSIDGDMKYYSRANLMRLVVLQTLCAIAYAYYRFGFIHRDLHTANVMLVTLPEVTAIPIMMPVYRTDGTVHFERKWILTNILVMIIDYGLSSIDSVHLDSIVYNHDRILSTMSIYNAYEGRNAFENDIALFILSIARIAVNEYSRDDLRIVSEDFVRILYRMYTGETLPDSQVSERDFFGYYNTSIKNTGSEYYYQTHPDIRYDPYGAVIDFCNVVKDLFISDSYDGYTNILARSNDRDLTSTDIVTTRQYYWYDKYRHLLTDVSIIAPSIENNVWYRNYVMRDIMPDIIFSNPSLTNEEVIEDIYRYVDNDDLSYSLIHSIYRYILYFRQFKLNILPLTYRDPSEILDDLDQYVNTHDDY